jgi:hypothetical protein
MIQRYSNQNSGCIDLKLVNANINKRNWQVKIYFQPANLALDSTKNPKTRVAFGVLGALSPLTVPVG